MWLSQFTFYFFSNMSEGKTYDIYIYIYIYIYIFHNPRKCNKGSLAHMHSIHFFSSIGVGIDFMPTALKHCCLSSKIHIN